MQQSALASHELLTARQVQHLLHIDRSTVYRMASDGRLPSIRVGKQLRFPADQFGSLVGGAAAGPDQDAEVDPQVAQATIDVAADLLGVAMVVTDMAGRPITDIANPSAWFMAHRDDDQLRACLDEWRALAQDADLAPRFVAAPLGFECARAFVRSGTALIGMVLAGGVAPHGTDPQGFHQLDEDQRRAVIRTLPRIASALARTTRTAL